MIGAVGQAARGVAKNRRRRALHIDYGCRPRKKRIASEITRFVHGHPQRAGKIAAKFASLVVKAKAGLRRAGFGEKVEGPGIERKIVATQRQPSGLGRAQGDYLAANLANEAMDAVVQSPVEIVDQSLDVRCIRSAEAGEDGFANLAVRAS